MTRTRDDDQLPLSRTPSVKDDVEREIAFHLHERAAELEKTGVPRERALAMARDSFGDRIAVEAECKVIEKRRRTSVRRSDKLEAFVQDMHVGVRVLRRSPAFTFASIVTLALGIGATAAVFSIVNRIILQPLPYPDANRLVTVVEKHANGWGNVPWSTFLDMQQQAQSFEGMAEYGSGTTTILTGSAPLRAQAAHVSSGFFTVFPTRVEMGRLLQAPDHAANAPPVAVVSHAFWRDVLGAPASLEGVHVKLTLDHAVVGVLPPEFDFPVGNQVWRPMELLSQSMSRTSHNWSSIAKLKPGIAPHAAQHELDAILERLKPLNQPDWDAEGSTVTTLQESVTGTLKTPLYLLLGASAVLLLAACTNLASAMLARGTARTSEFALRSALGATRLRLVRQLLTESALLAIIGSAAGLLLATMLLRALTPFAPASLAIMRVHIDAWVQGFALIVAVATTALFGLFPALRLSETNTTLALREGGGSGGGGTAGGKRMRAWNVLVGAEVALAVTLFAGSALLIKSFANVMATNLGFDPTHAVVVGVDLPPVNYGDTSSRVAEFHERALASLKRLPGVTSAGFVNTLPLGGSNPNGAMIVEGKPVNDRGFNSSAIYRVVGRGYFTASGQRLVKGRDFNDGDDRAGARVTIVNETFAATEWPGENPIGKRVMVAGMDSRDEPWSTVVGVVASVRASSVTGAFTSTYYFDYRQRPMYRSRSVSYVVRTDKPLDAMMPVLRDAMHAIDPQAPVALRPLEQNVARAVADRRFTMLVLGTFAATALLLAAIGIYGVVSYAVAQRTREIGVRRALGATPAGVHRLVLGSSMRAVIPGLIAGAGLSLVAAQALRSLLYGVTPFDVSALGIGILVLGAAAFVASVIPAFRATRVDPMVAMRSD